MKRKIRNTMIVIMSLVLICGIIVTISSIETALAKDFNTTHNYYNKIYDNSVSASDGKGSFEYIGQEYVSSKLLNGSTSAVSGCSVSIKVVVYKTGYVAQSSADNSIYLSKNATCETAHLTRHSTKSDIYYWHQGSMRNDTYSYKVYQFGSGAN